MLGKTVVNIEIKRLVAQTLPAITICIPALITISKLKQLNGFNEEFYQDYMKLLNEIYANQTLFEYKKWSLI